MHINYFPIFPIISGNSIKSELAILWFIYSGLRYTRKSIQYAHKALRYTYAYASYSMHMHTATTLREVAILLYYDMKLMTIQETSAILNIKVKTLYDWTHKKLIPYYKINRLVRFDEAEIRKWLQEKREKINWFPF